MQLSEMKKSLSDIESSQARSGKDLAQRVDEVKSGVKRLENYQAASEQSKAAVEFEDVLAWLSPFKPWDTQRSVLAQRSEGTSEWILQHEYLEQWKTGKIRTLWCPGIPGAGKTIIWSLVADHLQSFIRGHSGSGLALVVFDYRFPEMQLTEDLVLSIAQQFLVKATMISEERDFFHQTL